MEQEIVWTPGIGDPSFMGWFTVFAYLAAAFLCRRTAVAVERHVPADQRGRQPRIWNLVALLFVALGINKQLDLQSWFTAVGRAIVRREDWTDHKWKIQVGFIVACLAGAILVLALAIRAAQRRRREYGLLVLGVTLTVTFVLVRATSFHHMDRLIGFTFGGVRMNWALELSGIGIVALAAVRRRRQAETGALDRG